MDVHHDTQVLLSHAGWVRGLARALVRDSGEADDLAQETLVRAWERGPRAEPTRSAQTQRAWLVRVLRNTLTQHRRARTRREARERDVARPEAEPSVLDGLARLALHKQVVAAVEALDEPFRTTVILRWFEELPPRAIAQRMDVPVRTVNSRLERAHARLRERLQAEHGGDRARSLRALALLADASGPVQPFESSASSASSAGTHAAGGSPLTRVPNAARFAFVAVAVLAVVALLAWRTWWSPGDTSRSPSLANGMGRAANDLDALDGAALGATPPTRSAPARVRAVRGRVIDAVGAPIVGATLELVRPGSGGLELPRGVAADEELAVANATSDERGNWSLVADPAPVFVLRARAPGFALQRVDGVAADDVLEVRLAHAATLVVSVRELSRAPCARASLDVDGVGRSTPCLSGVTNVDGVWSTDELPPGAWSIYACAPDGPRFASFEVRARAGERIERALDLGPGLERSGIVVRETDGAPIAGAVIALARDRRACALAGPDGRFVLREPDRGGPFDLCARAPGFACAFRRAKEAPLRFELAEGVAFAGRVEDEHGAPVADAWVLAWSRPRSASGAEWDARTARTDRAGAFAIVDARTDLDYLLVARAEGRVSGELRVRANVARADVVLRLAPDARLEGTLRTLDGRPLAGAQVIARRVDGAPQADNAITTSVTIGGGAAAGSRASEDTLDLDPLRTLRATTRADGTFRIAGLAAGRHRVWALTADRGRVAERVLDVEAGARLAGIDLALAAGGALGVRVVDPDGAPIAGGWALLYRADERLEMRSAPVDGDGRVRFEGLAPARYRVSVMHRASFANGEDERPFATGELRDLAPDGAEAQLVLRRNRALGGQVVDAQGRSLAGALINARTPSGATDQVHSDLQGRFVVQLPEGERVTLAVDFDAPPKRWVGGVEDAQDGVVVELR